MRRIPLITAIVILVTVVGQASAAPPDAGVLVPGQSLGEVSLGATRAAVRATWGRAYGRCRSCPLETLYFNRFAFRPEGAGVEFRGGRVSAVFTLWGPAGWSTSAGLRVGDLELRATTPYPLATRIRCRGYDARVLTRSGTRSVVYLLDGRVWGFALLDRASSVCR